jgi:hypothetical protein
MGTTAIKRLGLNSVSLAVVDDGSGGSAKRLGVDRSQLLTVGIMNLSRGDLQMVHHPFSSVPV